MTPIRYLYFLILLCLVAGARTAQAQCTANAVLTVPTCLDESTGRIDLTASGGTEPYTYSWSDGQTTEDLMDLPAGVYTCTVTDALSCTATASATVTVLPPLVLEFGVPEVLTCLTPSTALVATASGGTLPYFYQWNNGVLFNNIIQVSDPGVYSVTVSDAFSCSIAGSVTVFMGEVPPIACASPTGILNCVVSSIQLDASCSSVGAGFTYAWTTANGTVTSGSNTLTPTVTGSGTYTLIVTNTFNGCTAITDVEVVQDANPPAISAGPDLSIPCGGGAIALGGNGSQGSIFTYFWSGPGIVSGDATLNPVVIEPGTYTLIITNVVNGCTATDVMTVSAGGTGLCSSIEGRVLQDTVANCATDAGEPPLAGWIVKAEGAAIYFGVTDANGQYQIFVEAGDTYAISGVAPSPLWLPCPAIPDVVVANPNDTLNAGDLLFQKLAGCPMLSVNIGSGNLRRCFSNNFFSVSYCNNGTEPAEDAYVVVALEPLFTPLVSSSPFTDLGNGMLKFDVGYLAVGQCGYFNFYAHLSCDAVVGQTHCTEAHIYPDSSCLPPDPQWSGASLRVNSECQSDSVQFHLENVGTGNMPNPLDYIVIEDQVMLMIGTVQLDAGEFTTVSVPANGSTWRLEVAQEPFHPGESRPAVSVEGCTAGATFSTGFVTQFPTDDADEFIDIDCKANIASYDPNDKQGFPLGYGADHYIRPGTTLEYQIRFQNTGNDTAFTVRLVDTLSAWLDPATMRSGTGSHPFSWDLSGAGVLSFLFENILLPDSNVNEAASHGFATFSIDHRADAPLETLIENTAHIYFDFNEAVVTNTTFHRLGENFVSVGLWQPQQPNYQVLVSPNPFSEAAYLEVKGLRRNTPLQLQVFDLQGKLQLSMNSEGAVFLLKKGNLPGGVYLFKIEQAGIIVGTGKLVMLK